MTMMAMLYFHYSDEEPIGVYEEYEEMLDIPGGVDESAPGVKLLHQRVDRD